MTAGSDGRIRELDGFRGAAVLAIVLLHYVVHHLSTVPGSLLAYAQKYFMFLWVGVDAFFVLSGFLIGGILLDQRASTNYFRIFYLRRALRIFPPYLLLLAAWLVARAVLSGHPYDWLLTPGFPAWIYVLYLQNFWMVASGSVGPLFVAATWSLAIEEQFYLLAPLLVRWVQPRRFALVLLAGVLSAAALRGWLALSGADRSGAQTHLLFSRWDSLLVGVLVAWAVRKPRLKDLLVASRRFLLMLFGVLLTLMAFMPVLFELPAALRSPVRAFLGFLVIALFFGVVLALLHIGALPRFAKALSARWLCSLGRISYFVYLFHTAILGLAFAILLGKNPILERGVDWAVGLAAFAVTLGCAEMSWRWLEAPLVALGHRQRYRASG